MGKQQKPNIKEVASGRIGQSSAIKDADPYSQSTEIENLSPEQQHFMSNDVLGFDETNNPSGLLPVVLFKTHYASLEGLNQLASLLEVTPFTWTRIPALFS